MSKLNIERLPSGAVFICDEDERVATIDISFLIKTGSLRENKYNNGISHFIEHLLFKGTKKRTYKEISEEIELKGGSLDAFTSSEYTCFYTHLLSEDYITGIELLTDLIFNPAFHPDDFEKEKKVIIQEVKSYFDSPENLLMKYHSERLFGKDSPYSYPIEGTLKSVNSLNIDDIIDYWKKYYVPENTIITCVGNCKFEEIRKELLNIPSIKSSGNLSYDNLVIQRDRKKVKCIYKNSLEQVYVAASNIGFKYNDERKYSLLVLVSILGYGMSSYLFMKLREENPLVYNVFAYLSQFRETGEIGIFLATDEKNVNTLITTMKKVLLEFTIDDDTLNKAKTRILKGFKIDFENTSRRAGFYQREYFYNEKIIELNGMSEKINNVKLLDVMELYKSLFSLENLTITTLGRVRNVKW